jgi:hypothetical protein
VLEYRQSTSSCLPQKRERIGRGITGERWIR